MQKTFDTPDPVELYVELGSGTVTVDATDTVTSQVEATGPRADEFTVELTGRRLSVIAPKGRFLGIGNDSHDIRVVVPTGVRPGHQDRARPTPRRPARSATSA